MDRSVVWAEIDAILAAIDPSRASWVALLDSSNSGAEPDADAEPAANSSLLLDFLVSLEDWAALNSLEEALPAMLAHGCDCVSFINGVIGESDLQEMGIRCPALRRKFLSAATDLPRGVETVAASLTQAATVETFLQRLCLQQHLAKDFADLRYSQIDCLAGVTDSELRLKYRIRKLAHRRRFLCCLSRLPQELLMQPQPQKQQQLSQLQPQPKLDRPLPISVGRFNREQQITYNSNSNSSSSSSGHFSGLSASAAVAPGASKPPSVCLLDPEQLAAAPSSRCRSADSVAAAVDSDCQRRRKLQRRRAAALPHSGTWPTFLPDVKPGWPHHPDVLLGGSVSYAVSYLGFRPLEKYTDESEVAQVMQAFRCKSVDILKLPRISLVVSYCGVKFVNPDNGVVITEHRITEIYFGCQDNTRRSNFAYVSRDGTAGTHYCHCFASHSQDAAVLIINTLAEACCLANQLIDFNQRLGASSLPRTRKSGPRTRAVLRGDIQPV